MEFFETTAQAEIQRHAETQAPILHEAVTSKEETNEDEMVYFSTTESVEKSLKGTIWWSWVVVACTSIFILFEVVAIFSALLLVSQRGSGFDAVVAFTLLKQLLYLSISGLIIWHGIQFGIQMRKALQHRDNPSLNLAFFHQSQYFKWVVIQIVAAVAISLVSLAPLFL